MDTEALCKEFQPLVEQGTQPETIIRLLAERGAPIIVAIKVVRYAFNVRLGVAKDLVSSSPEYHPQAAAMAPIHEEMINALRNESHFIEYGDGSFVIAIDLRNPTGQ